MPSTPLLVTNFSPRYKFLRSAPYHKYLIDTHAWPGSYQVTQLFISTVEHLQFLTDDIIEDPSIDQSLAKFPNLGAIVRWMSQNRF